MEYHAACVHAAHQHMFCRHVQAGPDNVDWGPTYASVQAALKQHQIFLKDDPQGKTLQRQFGTWRRVYSFINLESNKTGDAL